MSRLEKVWTYLYRDIAGEDEFYFVVGSTILWTTIWFWALALLFLYVDLTGRPSWMLRYKTQPGVNEPVGKKKLQKAVIVVVRNQVVITIPYLIGMHYVQRYVGSPYLPKDLPTVGRVILDLACFTLVDEILFYYFHRLAHWGPLYKNIHKIHHEWTAPIGVVAGYCHPLEHLICNLLPFTLGPVLMKSHMFAVMIWYTIALATTVITHSGYHLPLLPSPELHDYHHLKFSLNYGVLGLMDWFHNTDKQFRVTKQYRRHQTLYSLTPMSEQHPSGQEKKID